MMNFVYQNKGEVNCILCHGSKNLFTKNKTYSSEELNRHITEYHRDNSWMVINDDKLFCN